MKLTDEKFSEVLRVIEDGIRIIHELDAIMHNGWWFKNVNKECCKQVERIWRVMRLASSYHTTSEQQDEIAKSWGYESVDDYIKGIVGAKL